MPRLRNAEARTNVIADPLPPAVGLNAGEDVEAGFEPAIDALRNFDGLMFRMVGGQYAILHRLASLGGEIRMQLDHGAGGRDGVRAINLNFVIVLCVSRDRRQSRR